MTGSIWDAFSARVSTIGEEFHDADLRTQKMVLVGLSLSAIPLGVIWTLVEFSVSEPQNAVISGAIALLILVNFLFYAYNKNFSLFRFSQLVIFLTFPFLLHFSIGGFTKSANLIWGLATPLIALLSSRLREGTPWFIAFLLLVAVSGVIDPLLFPHNDMSVAASFFEFSFNIINISFVVYLMLIYFIHQKNHAYTLLDEEQKKSESLLLNVLPKEIAPVLKSGIETIADRFGSASILFADVVDFTRLSIQMAPEEMVDLLNYIFTQFDSLVEEYGLEKIRTIGDNYMVASGVPRPKQDHAQAIASLALDMIASIEALAPKNGKSIDFRIGINSGPVVAGVIGRHKFQYDLWGDTVNTASRMESHGIAGKIQISQDTQELIQQHFICEPRGTIEIKGKGKMETWFLVQRRGLNRVSTNGVD